MSHTVNIVAKNIKRIREVKKTFLKKRFAQIQAFHKDNIPELRTVK
nr:hypothetical protein [Chryseobacterium nematophagum]